MTRTGLSSRGYSVRKEDLSLEQLEKLRDELTVTAFSPVDYALAKPVPFKLYQESNNKIYIPKSYGLKRFGIPNVNKLQDAEDIDVEFIGSLRHEQVEPANLFLAAAKDPVRMGGIIAVVCGFGKTILAIYLLTKLKKKTIVVVHKDFLLQQWKERILQVAPTARVGLIKAQTIDIENKDIVIASLQSLSMKEYDDNIFKQFGFTIFDECFPYDQDVVTAQGPVKIGRLFYLWDKGNKVSHVMSYNKDTEKWGWSKVTFAWKKPYEGFLIKMRFANGCITRSTPDHKFLTTYDGMVECKKLMLGDHVVSSNGTSTIEEFSFETFRGYVYDIEVRGDHNFMVGTQQNGVCCSNCHHLSGEVFSQALKKVNTLYSLGLSATPRRKDGLTKVFTWHLGDIVFNKTKRTDTVDVKMVEYFDSNPSYSQEQYMFQGKLNTARMINNICEFEPRVEFIVKMLKEVLEDEPERKVLVLSDRRSHVDAMVTKMKEQDIDTAAYYGGMKAEQLKQAEERQVITSTFSMSAEALDIRGLNTLVLASPKTDVVQASGRILRDKPEDRTCTPLIIDIVDKFSIFVNQAKKRAAYYKKCKYNIIDTDVFADKNKIEMPGKCVIVETEPCNEL